MDLDISNATGPKYRALAAAVEQAIEAKELKPNDKMPTVRDLAWQLKVTPGTVARAYQRLTDKGVLHARVGSGTFVSAPDTESRQDFIYYPEETAPDSGVLDLMSPRLPDVGQIAQIREALRKVADLPTALFLQYPDMAQSRALRETILTTKLKSFPTDALTPDHVVLSHGGQHALSLVMQAVLSGATPAVLTEELAYPGFRHTARQLRARPVSVAQDEEGPVPSAIHAACLAHDVQLLVTSAHAHNPTTITTSPARRREIVELARLHDFQIIDDQSYGLVRSDRPSYREMAPERVWFISALSKSISPNLRLGWFVTPDGKSALGQRTANFSSFGVSLPIVQLGQSVLTAANADEVRDRVRAENAHRVGVMQAELGQFGLRTGPDISFAYLPMPTGWRASAFQRAAENAGILLRNVDNYTLVDGRAPNAVRIAINSAVSRDRFQQACVTLRRLLESPPHEIGV